jgi:glutaminase
LSACAEWNCHRFRSIGLRFSFCRQNRGILILAPLCSPFILCWHELCLWNTCHMRTASMKPPLCSSPVQDWIEQLHTEFGRVTDGKVATYIPELANANPNWFGICLVTMNGAVYEIGDSAQPFTIQSISKPLVYGLALEDHGRADVLARVGLEPTGDAFNSISLDPVTGRPRNPMINAGAIATAGLISGKTPQVRLKRLMEMMGTYAGRELELDQSVYRSESETGHRNRAIGHMLRNFNMIAGDPAPVVELYFQQCSISVTCRDLALMAGTLANRGVNPVTGKQAIRGEYVESVLSVMGSCGMYDFAGEWIYKIGMPAKSGVAGGIIAVLPGQLGIGVFSPPLDSRGNSVRGIGVCNELSRSLDLHVFNRPSPGRSVIRLRFTGAELNSSRVRTPQESHALHEFGAAIKAYQLQGHLTFATSELVIREILDDLDATDYLVLDLKRVLDFNESACRLLYQFLLKLSHLGKSLIFTHADRFPLLRRFMKVKLGTQYEEIFRAFDDNDPALEWCENRLLETTLPARPLNGRVAQRDYELFADLAADELAIVVAVLKRRIYQNGEAIIHVGDDARHLFFLARGSVSVLITLPSGRLKRLATFSAGMAFGEMAVIDGAPRSAMIRADTEAECDLLALEDLKGLGESHPAVKIKLLQNLSLGLCRKLRKANREIGILE